MDHLEIKSLSIRPLYLSHSHQLGADSLSPDRELTRTDRTLKRAPMVLEGSQNHTVFQRRPKGMYNGSTHRMTGHSLTISSIVQGI